MAHIWDWDFSFCVGCENLMGYDDTAFGHGIGYQPAICYCGKISFGCITELAVFLYPTHDLSI